MTDLDKTLQEIRTRAEDALGINAKLFTSYDEKINKVFREDVPTLLEMVELTYEQLHKCKAETWMDCLNIDLEKIIGKYK